MSTYIELPHEKTTSKLTDWLEINALLATDNYASAQDLKVPLLSEQEVEEDQIKADDSDESVAQVFSEVENRLESAKDGYPFKLIGGNKIKKNLGRERLLPYIFCLLISYFGPERKEYSPQWKTNNMAKKFEELCGEAAKALLKSSDFHAHTKIFGYPRIWGGKESNPSFIKALKEICTECGEMQSAERKTANAAKDGGLDIFAWRRFPDQLPGNVVFAGQCAIGKDWDNKLHAVDEFIDWFLRDPTQRLKGMFIPHIPDLINVLQREEWLKNTLTAGMIFNRCRIAFLVKKWNDSFIAAFCKKVLISIRKNAEIKL